MNLRKLSVAVITMRFPVQSETFTSARMRTLVGAGHRVRVFALRNAKTDRDDLARERGVDDIPTSHNDPASNIKGLLDALRRPRLLVGVLGWLAGTSRGNWSQLIRALAVLPRSFDILDTLEGDAPDVLHTEWGHYPAVVAYLVQKRLPKTVVSVSLIAYDLDTEFGGTVEVVRSAEVIRTQAQVNVDKITDFTGVDRDRVAVIYDGVDLKSIHAAQAGAAKIAGRFVVAGRLVPKKGVDAAIRVFAAVRSQVTDISLCVLGEGQDLARLQRLARDLGVADAVRFLGHVSHQRVIEEFSAAEILLHLSHSERLPNVVKEGMACRCVCITTRTEGIEELVEDGTTGYLVGLDETERAAAIAIELLKDRRPMQVVACAAHRFVQSNFDHDRNVRLLLDLWRAAPGINGHPA